MFFFVRGSPNDRTELVFRDSFGRHLGGPGGHFEVNFGAYFGNFGACWAFGRLFGSLGFHLGAHVALLDKFLAIFGSIDLFGGAFRTYFWIPFETSFSSPFRDEIGFILGSLSGQAGP